VWYGMLVRGESHSDADGACPLLTCIASKEVQSGDFYGPKGTEQPMLVYNSQSKGPTEKVVLKDWEKEVIKQGDSVWVHTYASLNINFDI
jgi:hypothetical protein